MRPMRRPERARARSADCAPGPGVFERVPPVALSLMCRAVMPSSLQRTATSWAASIAAYGDDCKRKSSRQQAAGSNDVVNSKKKKQRRKQGNTQRHRARKERKMQLFSTSKLATQLFSFHPQKVGGKRLTQRQHKQTQKTNLIAVSLDLHTTGDAHHGFPRRGWKERMRQKKKKNVEMRCG